MQRLAATGAILLDALVESRKLIREAVADADRRLGAGTAYPIALMPTNVASVERELRRAQRNVGTTRSRGSGNSTRRVRLTIQLPANAEFPDSFADYLTGARAVGFIPTSDLDDAANDLQSVDAFDPGNIVNARELVMRAIARRQGQPDFRRRLLHAYEWRCAISGCDATEVLEAAHIIPYAGAATHHIQNGLLLRADLHTLFDRGLLGVKPDSWHVIIHPSLEKGSYGCWHNAILNRPPNSGDWPSSEALRRHLVAAGLTQV